MKKIIIISSLLSFVSCSIKYPKRYAHKHNTPTKQIKDYKEKSQKNSLDSVISKGNLPSEEISFLSEVKHPNFNSWVNYFSTRSKDRFLRYLNNGEKYRPMIESIFADYGLPKELYFVGLIESGYYLHSKSSASAVGPWQFVSATAKRYDLRVNWSIDERKNIVKSTKAAAEYFQDLYNIFGSWELALAAYNAGEYGIIRRIRKAGTRDFYELSRKKVIPKETQNYIPKVQAAMHVYRNAKKYGIIIPEFDDHYSGLKKVHIKRSTSFKKLAHKNKIPHHVLAHFNNDLKRNKIPSRTTIFIPNKFDIRQIKAIKTKVPFRKISSSKSFKTYKVRKGDNLTKIARKNNTKISILKKHNRIKRNKIFIGQKIKIPTNSRTYLVRNGDNLFRIALKYKVKISYLKNINKLKNSKIFPGQRLIIRN